jgi:hypothetical protein
MPSLDRSEARHVIDGTSGSSMSTVRSSDRPAKTWVKPSGSELDLAVRMKG